MNDYSEIDHKNPPSIAGWKPPIMYDATIDAVRLVTQEDVELLVEMAREYQVLMREIGHAHQRKESLVQRHKVTFLKP